MVLKIVRYLGQQGYKSSEIVVLTPYLGQLRALQKALKKDNDPVLDQMDTRDLVRAGLMTESEAKGEKASLRLATIGVYFIFFYVYCLENAKVFFRRQLPRRRKRYCHCFPYTVQRHK